MRPFKGLISALFLFCWSISLCIGSGHQNDEKKVPVYHFDNLTEGRITAFLKIPESNEIKINLLYKGQGVEEKIFTIPFASGTRLYPLGLSPDTALNLEIQFDLRYNFCKVYINGKWLTSVLSKQQWLYANGISAEWVQGNDDNFSLTGIHEEGKLHESVKPIKVVAFGNSTTAYRKTITGVYSQRMPEYFKKRNIPVQVFNEGIGGSHTGHLTDNAIHKIRHALDRFDDAVLAKNPDYVTFNFGINDSWVDTNDPNGQSRIPLTKFRENLLFMIHTLKERNVTVILLTPNAIGGKYESWRHKRLGKYVVVIRRIAEKEKLPILDQWELMKKLAAKSGIQIEDYLLPDAMHTNDLWHKISAELLSDLIIGLEIKTHAGAD